MHQVRVRKLLGRAAEIDLLVSGLDGARAGTGALFLVSGDGGIGKTALAEELCRRAALAGADILWGRCLEEGAPPFWPWIQILRELGPELARRNPDDESQESRFAQFESAARLLKDSAAPAGAVVVLDDLHWADEPSLLLLRHLSTEIAQSRLLVIGTYREGELDQQGALARLLPDLRRERVTRSLHLHGLNEPEVAELAAELSGDRMSRAASKALHATAEGNPFFVTEIVRLVGAEGELGQLPEGIRQVIRRRTALLSPAGLELLNAASVIGREFSLKILEPLTGKPRGRLLSEIDEAIAARVVTEVPRAPGTFHFNHALIRETLYDDLPMSRRVELHRLAGEALENLVGQDLDAHLNELATHFFKASSGGDSDKALDYASRAADYAMSRFAFEEAARLYRLALDALDQLQPDDSTRARLLLSLARAQHLSDEMVAGIDTSLELVQVAARLGDGVLAAQAALVTEAVMTLGAESEKMEALCTQAMLALGDADDALRARLLAQLSMALHFRDSARSVALARGSLEVAERSGDPIALAAALNVGQNVPFGMRSPEEAIRAGERLISLGAETGSRKVELWGHFWRVAGLFEIGDMQALEDAIEDHGRLAEEIRDPSARWRTTMSRAVLAFLSGRLEEAERRALEVKAKGTPNQVRVVKVMQAAQLAFIWRSQGRFEETIAMMDRAIQADPNITVRAVRTNALAQLGRVDEARRDFAELTAVDLRTRQRAHTWLITIAHIAEASVVLGESTQFELLYELFSPYPDRNVVAASGTAASHGSASRYLGLLAMSLGRLDDAIAHYEQAIAMNERQRALPYLAYSQLELAEALVRRGRSADRSKAQALAAVSFESATRMGMHPLVADARTLVAKIGGAEKHAPLSRRQAEIATLVAAGLTNKQIADKLHLSVRTAENHVENICNKLGFGSRAQIAVWATQKGLR